MHEVASTTRYQRVDGILISRDGKISRIKADQRGSRRRIKGEEDQGGTIASSK
jgi:hypothetical protein